MNFSETLKLTSGQFLWSPNGRYCALVFTARLEIRDGSTLASITTFNCSDSVSKIEWSPDSSLILTASCAKGVIEVWQPAHTSWRCRINEGSAGLVKLSWAPDSRHILTTAEFYLQMTVWSLSNRTVSYIKFPKEGDPGYDFSHDGNYLAVAKRQDCKDFISLFETNSWHLVKCFECGTCDLSGLSFAPDDSVIAVWDSPTEYKILIYTLTGQCLTSYSAYQWALGVKSVKWSSSSQFLAIGSYDQTIRLMNHLTWNIITEFTHSASLEKTDCQIFNEIEKPLTGYPAALAKLKDLPTVLETYYECVNTRPVNFTQLPSDKSDKTVPKIGVSNLVFSSDGRYLASQVENMPAVVWIWMISKMSLRTVLVHCKSVKDMAWSKRQINLAICTGGSHIYLWTPFGCLTVSVPDAPTIQISSLKWHPSGCKLSLIGKNEASVAYFKAPLENSSNLERG